MILKKFLLFHIFFISGIVLYSCSENTYLDQEKMIRVYTDLILAGDSLNFKSAVTGKDALPDSLRTRIFKKHNVSPDDYKKTIDYYNENPEYWESFFTRTTIYLDSLKKAAAR